MAVESTGAVASPLLTLVVMMVLTKAVIRNALVVAVVCNKIKLLKINLIAIVNLLEV
jgi:hypothetical protein